MPYTGNRVVGRDRPPNTATFDLWLEKNHPELVGLWLEIDRECIKDPSSKFGLINWLVQLAFECGSLSEIREMKAVLRKRKSIGITALYETLNSHEQYLYHRNSFED